MITSYDVLVVQVEEFLCVGHAKEAATKPSSLSGVGGGGGAIIQLHIYPKQLIACTSDLHHLTQRHEHYDI